MFDLEDLRTFVEVADAGGVTPAARRLGLSKSIVSRRLARLEEGLGARLLSRPPRGVRQQVRAGKVADRRKRVPQRPALRSYPRQIVTRKPSWTTSSTTLAIAPTTSWCS